MPIILALNKKRIVSEYLPTKLLKWMTCKIPNTKINLINVFKIKSKRYHLKTKI